MYFSRFKTPARLLLLTNERVSQRFVFKCLFCAYSNGWDTGQRRQSSSKFGGGDGCRGPQLLWEDLHHWSVKTDVRFLLINSLQAESSTISPICFSEWTGTRWKRTGVHTYLALYVSAPPGSWKTDFEYISIKPKSGCRPPTPVRRCATPRSQLLTWRPSPLSPNIGCPTAPFIQYKQAWGWLKRSVSVVGSLLKLTHLDLSRWSMRRSCRRSRLNWQTQRVRLTWKTSCPYVQLF